MRPPILRWFELEVNVVSEQNLFLELWYIPGMLVKEVSEFAPGIIYSMRPAWSIQAFVASVLEKAGEVSVPIVCERPFSRAGRWVFTLAACSAYVDGS